MNTIGWIATFLPHVWTWELLPKFLGAVVKLFALGSYADLLAHCAYPLPYPTHTPPQPPHFTKPPNPRKNLSPYHTKSKLIWFYLKKRQIRRLLFLPINHLWSVNLAGLFTALPGNLTEFIEYIFLLSVKNRNIQCVLSFLPSPNFPMCQNPEKKQESWSGHPLKWLSSGLATPKKCQSPQFWWV